MSTWSDVWPVAHPRAEGPWTLRSRDRWGVLNPESGQAEAADPSADPKLPGLAIALASGRLVGYRHGRRAVAATATGFVKVVRPSRVEALVARHELLTTETTGPAVPAIVGVEPDGRVELQRMPGRSLHEHLRVEPDRSLDDVGSLVASLHTLDPPCELTPRGRDDPLTWSAVSRRVPTRYLPAIQFAAERLPHLEPRAEVVVHGDLHDKNVFCDAGALIDLDGVGLGAAEDDIANLAVHLELRNLQARTGLSFGARTRALYNAYRRHRPLDPQRLHAVESHTWFRLACLYQYRAASAGLVPSLLGAAIEEPGEHDRDLRAAELARVDLD